MFSTISGKNLVFTDGTIRVSGTTLCLQKYDWRKIPIYNNGDVIYVLECDLSQNKIKNDLFKWQFKDGMIRSSGNSDFCWSVPLSQTGVEQQVRIQFCDMGSVADRASARVVPRARTVPFRAVHGYFHEKKHEI